MKLESQTCHTPMTMPLVATVVHNDQIMNRSLRVVNASKRLSISRLTGEHRASTRKFF